MLLLKNPFFIKASDFDMPTSPAFKHFCASDGVLRRKSRNFIVIKHIQSSLRKGCHALRAENGVLWHSKECSPNLKQDRHFYSKHNSSIYSCDTRDDSNNDNKFIPIKNILRKLHNDLPIRLLCGLERGSGCLSQAFLITEKSLLIKGAV